jgi:hypothetical protein
VNIELWVNHDQDPKLKEEWFLVFINLNYFVSAMLIICFRLT